MTKKERDLTEAAIMVALTSRLLLAQLGYRSYREAERALKAAEKPGRS